MIKYISILPIVLYCIYIWQKYGIQKSISESYYRLTNKEKPLFYLALVLTSFNFIIGWVYENPSELISNILIFLAGSFICFVGAASEFKGSKLTEIVHYVGATGGYILGYAFIVSVYKEESLFFIIPSLILIWGIKNFYEKNKKVVKTFFVGDKLINSEKGIENHFIWWAEIIGFLTIYLATIL